MRVVTQRAAALLIVTALSACDNVQWGGASVRIVQPPPPEGAAAAGPDAETLAGLGLPTGTVLFHVQKQGNGARIVPVAEVSGDSLRTLRRPAGVAPEAYEGRFRESVLAEGAQLELFRRGASVGTATVGAAGPATTCGVPTATGNMITVAAAADQADILAFRKGLSPDVMGEYRPPQVDGTINRYASIVAERLVLQNGLPRPRSWTGAQRDLQALDVVRGGHQEMAATYLSGDQLQQGPGQPDGYSVLYVASYETRSGYTPLYQEVYDYRKTGKRAPKLVDYLNWNERGGNDILIQVFGPSESWYEAVSQDRGGNRWVKVWEGTPCGRDAQQG